MPWNPFALICVLPDIPESVSIIFFLENLEPHLF
jgi:hypothetical protein